MLTAYTTESMNKDKKKKRVSSILANGIDGLLQSNEFFEALQQAGVLSGEQRHEIAKSLKNAMLQASETLLKEQQLSSDTEPVARLLGQKDGFSLLLLTVESFDNSGSRKFIVCVDDERAKVILAKDSLTVLDYERSDIVRGFGEKEVVSTQALNSAIEHFVKYPIIRKAFKM